MLQFITTLLAISIASVLLLPSFKIWRKPPSFIVYLVAHLCQLFQPTKVHLNNAKITNGKVLFVLNHQTTAMDAIAIFSSLYLSTGLFPRVIADRLHFVIPFWGWVLIAVGAFPGTRENCSALMDSGYPILVFPGGREEAFRKSHEPKYVLKWKKRTGFVKMAAKHGYSIVPVAMVGWEDQIKIVLDIPLDFIIWVFGEKKPEPLTYPLIVPTSWQRQYCVIGPVLSVDSIDHENEDHLLKIRDQVKNQVIANVNIAKKMQTNDPHRHILTAYFGGLVNKLT